MRTFNHPAKALLFVALFCACAPSQDDMSRHAPSVSLEPVPLMTVVRGRPNTVDLRFRVESGFHINSNAPKAEFLIPTVLKMNPPTDIVIGRVTYPAGKEMSFAFAPDDKLSVYSGGFTLGVVVRPLASVVPAKYSMRGQLRYQACDNAACYPPKRLPIVFEVQVARNPAQSPHIHR